MLLKLSGCPSGEQTRFASDCATLFFDPIKMHRSVLKIWSSRLPSFAIRSYSGPAMDFPCVDRLERRQRILEQVTLEICFPITLTLKGPRTKL